MPQNNKGTGRYQITDELVNKNIERFHEFKSAGTLGNNGPIMPGNSTSFSPDRWKEFIDLLAEQAPKKLKKFEDATGAKAGQTTKQMSVTKDHEEFVVDKPDMKVYDDETGELVYSDSPDLPTKGMMSDAKEEGVKWDKPNYKFSEPFTGLSIENARKTMEANKKAIKEKYAKANEAQLIAKAKAKKQDIELGGVKERLSDILTTYDAEEKLAKQQEAKRKEAEKLAKEQAALNKELESKMADAEADQEMMEAEFDFATLDDAFDDSILEGKLNKASKEQDDMEAMADLRENPMSAMSDEEKGDWEIKKLEPKDKSGTAGISMIIEETGLDAKKATALYGKLKSLCK